ncbi:hypothetical protein EVAR_39423_1 [Eumeta japonica]|uniref:Mariner Mos1 transposase n=1 Tax=Eumeta variegata TaxID=151549 RepID=A0A4C1Z042_EUMVA|nr:hypothetical protein EVAR_39423_1 [Eumeta japonica]
MNSDCYTTICLLEVIDELHKNNPKRRIILHHENDSSHKAKQTNKFLGKSAYSPDLIKRLFCESLRISEIDLSQTRKSGQSRHAAATPALDVNESDTRVCARAHRGCGDVYRPPPSLRAPPDGVCERHHIMAGVELLRINV